MYKTDYNLVLASSSPRRHHLLREAGFSFEIRPKAVSEDFPAALPAEEVPIFLAEKKADAFRGSLQEKELLITADTVVVFGGKILGKPQNEPEAAQMLSALSGQEHQVITAVCLLSAQKKVTFSDTTLVKFASLSAEEISGYLRRYRPYDKAGAYGIQEPLGMWGIAGIVGSFYNVMGFPLHAFYQQLKRF